MNIEVKVITEEMEEALTFLKANALFCVIWNTLEALRSKIKYEELSEVELEIYESIRSKIYELIGEHDVQDLFN